jgi:hypothetical protein
VLTRRLINWWREGTASIGFDRAIAFKNQSESASGKRYD